MGRRREKDEQIDRGGMMTEKKNVGEQHLSYKDALDFYWSVRLTAMQPGLVFYASWHHKVITSYYYTLH